MMQLLKLFRFRRPRAVYGAGALAAVCAFASCMVALPALAQRKVPPPSREAVTFSYAPVVKKAAPAVVNVYVRGRVQQQAQNPFANDPFFRRFFGDRLNQERMQNSLGSGVIISADGVVVTNTHVIKLGQQAEVKVVLADKREFDARVLMQDEKTDIAVLKLDAPANTRFDFIEFEDSDSLEVGDMVLAIGNPFGVGQTVTQGIVSALARSEIGQSEQQVFIQTDAAINPGNSGGGLVDMNGRLVGINTAIFSQSGGSHGIGFAIPSNLVRVFADSAITGKKVERPWLGAKLEALTREVAEALNLERAAGAVVTRIKDGSPADTAGLQVGDVIVMVDGTDVADARAVHYRLTTRGIGKLTRFDVMRKGRRIPINVALTAAPQAGRDDVRNLSGVHPFDGARVSNIVGAVAEDLGIDDEQGVVIVSVRPNSIAANLGFKAGDVVLQVLRTDVDTVQTLERTLRERQRLWPLAIRRQGQVLQIQVPG